MIVLTQNSKPKFFKPDYSNYNTLKERMKKGGKNSFNL